MTNENRWALAFVLIGTLFFNKISIAQASTELARVNGSVITLEDFNKKFKENSRFFQIRPQTKKGLLDDLIRRELGIQEAKKAALDKDPEVVERVNNLLYHAFLEKKLTKEFEAIHISDDDAKKYYSRNPEIRTSHIFIAVRPDSKAVEQKQAYERIKKIQENYLADGKMSFAEVAQRFSEGPAAPMGGDLDYQTKDRVDPTYYETALKLGSPGKVSGIVRSQFGYHIIKLTALKTWDEVDRAQVKRLVFEEQRSKIFEKYMDSLKSQSKVAVHSELIKE